MSLSINTPGGLGNARNKWINVAKARDLITVILPSNVSFLFDHLLLKVSIFVKISIVFTSQIFYSSVVNVAPRILKCPYVQSSL